MPIEEVALREANFNTFTASTMFRTWDHQCQWWPGPSVPVVTTQSHTWDHQCRWWPLSHIPGTISAGGDHSVTYLGPSVSVVTTQPHIWDHQCGGDHSATYLGPSVPVVTTQPHIWDHQCRWWPLSPITSHGEDFISIIFSITTQPQQLPLISRKPNLYMKLRRLSVIPSGIEFLMR